MALAVVFVSLSDHTQGIETDQSPLPMLRVLIRTGQGDHDWRATSAFLKRILADTGRFDVRVCETPTAITARTLEDFDVLVDDCGSPPAGPDVERAIASFVESGKGLVMTHWALVCHTAARDSQAIGASARPSGDATVKEYSPVFASLGPHPAIQFWKIRVSQSEHPIVKGVHSGAVTADVLYGGMTIRPGAEVLAVALGESGSGIKEAPILVVARHGKGRVFCPVLGHDLAAIQEKAFIATFARGTEWAATGAVTLPADLGEPRPNKDAVRALLITGGHDHETTFYSLFDGYRDLDPIPVASSASAFQTDLRKKYDVVIMYDFSRDLSDAGKKNLRDFVESGKGIVVLHHALLNYQDWPWWYEDTVGGSYRLRREGKMPSSTVKADQQLFVTAEAEHPITAGIGRFHIVDETYKGMKFSPRVRPLLTTDNRNSDPVLAWVGPSASSRVVAIQLGHGPTAFGHPTYRALVHNAILWAANRLN
jgi:type 1 glutamine amidotransferase